MAQIFDTLRGFLDGENMKYDVLGERTALRFGFGTERHRWVCVAEAREDQRVLVFVGVLPTKAAPAQRAAVAELLMRINFGLTLGNFELDFDDGEIRFRTSLDVAETPITTPLVRQIVHANLATVARHAEAIERTAKGSDAAA